MGSKKMKSQFRILFFKTVILLLFIVFCVLIYFTTDTDYPGLLNNHYPKLPVKKEYEASLIMVGDALIHRPIYEKYKSDNKYDFNGMFQYIKPIIKNYDLAYYNQEAILGGSELGLSTYPRFNSPYELGDAFVKNGFNLVSLANNHTLDRGLTAINNSLNYWNGKDNVLTAGSYKSEEDRNKINIKKVNNISYTMLSYTTDTNGLRVPSSSPWVVNVYDKEKVKNDIEKLKDKVDIIMVAMHWGEEYTHEPVYSQKEIAKYLSSLGVDIIIGTHPHVIEPIEFIDNTLVIYSLGNFVSSQIGIDRLTGLMASITINKKTIDGVTTEIKLIDPTIELIYTNKNDFIVYPFSKLNNNILNDYENIFNRQVSYATKYMSDIKVIK